MTKEDFTSKLLGREPGRNEYPIPVKPCPCFKVNPGFEKRMLLLSGLERYAPKNFKRHWAHHRYLLFHRDQAQ